MVMEPSPSSPSRKKLKHAEDAFSQDLQDVTTSAESGVMDESPQTPLNDSEHGSENSDDIDNEVSDYNPEDLSYMDEFVPYDETTSLQAQFDAADLPPGVEASVPWLEGVVEHQKKAADASTSVIAAEEEGEQVLKKYEMFKTFDSVEDFSDHHYCKDEKSKSAQASRDWAKTIHHEWTLLEKNLPDTIFVRVYEERMDLMRAVIIGAAGTPYHDGLFFFDLFFPPNYPNTPPTAYYHSGGLRLNPNLYENGYVCLSLLNTWDGPKWQPGKSTILQVLLSLQALVLNEHPYFNEPGYARSAGTIEGNMMSRNYNWNTFVFSCKTMLYSLHRPQKNFEDLIAGHFRERGEVILEACDAYIKGYKVGYPNEGEVQAFGRYDRQTFESFQLSLRTVVASLVPAFIKNGAMACVRFIPLGDVNRTVALKVSDTKM